MQKKTFSKKIMSLQFSPDSTYTCHTHQNAKITGCCSVTDLTVSLVSDSCPVSPHWQWSPPVLVVTRQCAMSD